MKYKKIRDIILFPSYILIGIVMMIVLIVFGLYDYFFGEDIDPDTFNPKFL